MLSNTPQKECHHPILNDRNFLLTKAELPAIAETPTLFG